VYVRLHHGSDVVAGAALGLALGFAMRPFVNGGE
jgi:membrane-associated phospholipid phosphatase